MAKHVDVLIIGAGSAGLSALRQVREKTDNFVIIDHGPLGTKCARTGCMPSKALIYTARDFHRRNFFSRQGIAGGENLRADIPKILDHVRKLRDEFSAGMKETTKELAGDKLINATAKIISPDTVIANGETIKADKIIIATGSSPKVPGKWQNFKNKILTSENIFEQENMPKSIAVVGLGPIGLELGQALSRIGVNVTGFDIKNTIAGLSDPEVNSKAIEIISSDFNIKLGKEIQVQETGNGLVIKDDETELHVDAILAAMGVKPNIDDLGLENLGVKLNEKGLPAYNPQTSQIENTNIYIAGDVNGCRPILHECLDEGFIAGTNSLSEQQKCFCRRTDMSIVFSEPQIASVGKSYKQVNDQKMDFVTGSINFTSQARAKLQSQNQGLAHIYVDKKTAHLAGCEMVCPDAEHLAHLMALAVQKEITIFEMLEMPFYHPTIEEAIRTALRNAADKISQNKKPSELSLCSCSPENPLC